MITKFLSSLATVAFILNPVLAHAQEAPDGKTTGLSVGEKAPFAGILLDSNAWAKVMAEKMFNEKEFQLKLDFEVQKKTYELGKIIEQLQNRIDVEKTKTDALDSMKTKQVNELTKSLAKEYSKTDYSLLWAAGGFVLGIAATIAVVYAVK